MKFSSLLLLCVAVLGGVANAALLPTPESGNPNLLPDGTPPTKLLPGGGGSGGGLLPTTPDGGGKLLPRPAEERGGGDRFRESSQIKLLRLVGTDVGNNTNATLEPGEPIHGGYEGNPGGKSLWWRFVARFNGYLVISTKGSDFDTVLSVYFGDTISTLTPVAHDNDSGPRQTSMVSVRIAAGTTYHIAVDGYNGASGDIKLKLVGVPDPSNTSARPINDDYDDAVELMGHYAVDYGYNYGATRGPEDFLYSAGQTVWWTWQAPATGRVSIYTAGSDFDTFLFVYGPISIWGYIINDDVGDGDRSSIVRANVRKGDVLDIAVDGWLVSSGFIVLTLDLDPRLVNPSNDEFEFRTGIQGNSYSVTTTNVGALANDPVEPLHAGLSTTGSLWWTWTAPNNGVVTFSARATPGTESQPGSPLKPVIAAYRGARLAQLKTIANAVDDDLDGGAEVSFTVKKGETYQVAVARQLFGASGAFTFRLRYEDGSPAVANQPQDSEIVEGGKATFTVSLSPKTQTPVNLRWQVQTGKNSWSNLNNDTQYSGVRTLTLTVKNVTMDMDGLRYRCVIKNKQGTRTSKPATLSVSQAPATTQKKKQSGNKLLGSGSPSGGGLLGN